MPDYLQSSYSFYYQSQKTFAVGPLNTGQALRSGEYFSGRWALWIANADGGKQVKYKRLFEPNENVSLSDTGFNYTGLGPTILNTEYNSRFLNPSLSFTASGIPIVALQDNGDVYNIRNSPEILVSYSGDKTVRWIGYAPSLSNTLETNWPHSLPNSIFPVYQTGVLVCYYSKTDSSGLYGRRIDDGFSSEFIINSGLRTGYIGGSKSEPITNSFVRDMPPYKNIISSINLNQNLLKITAQRSSINFAFDNFETMEAAQTLSYLLSGYGRWAVSNALAFPSGSCFYPDYYFYDKNVNYLTGNITTLNSGVTIVNYSGIFVGRRAGRFFSLDQYFYNTFESLSSGAIQSSGYFLSGGLSYITGINSTGFLGYIIQSG